MGRDPEILSRGGLKWPTKFLIDIVADVYTVFNCLISDKYEQAFLGLTNQRQVLVAISIDFINRPESACECGFPMSKLVYKSVFIASNIMLNNYTKLFNEKKCVAKSEKSKRKLSMLVSK